MRTMNRISSRSLRLSDAAEVTEILNENEALEPAGINVDEAEILELMQGPGVDLDAGAVGIESEGVLVAFGALQASPPMDTWRAQLWGGVRTAGTRRGLGRQVIAELTAAAMALRDAVDPRAPGELRVWVPDSRAGLAALLAAETYPTLRHFSDLRCDLAHPLPAPVAGPADVEITGWTPELDRGVWAASNDSFADHWGSVPMDYPRWRHLFADSSRFRPGPSRVALDPSGRVVSFVLAEEFPADTVSNGYRTGYLSRVGTVRAARGRGVASALLLDTLRALAADGDAYAELTVDAASPTGADRIYQRVGFRPLRSARVAGRSF